MIKVPKYLRWAFEFNDSTNSDLTYAKFNRKGMFVFTAISAITLVSSIHWTINLIGLIALAILAWFSGLHD